MIKALFGKVKDKAGKLKSKAVGMVSMAIAAVMALPVAAGAAPVDFSTTTGINVTPTDVIGTGFSFMGMFDEYTMIVLGIIFAPVAIGFIVWIWRKLPKLGSGKA